MRFDSVDKPSQSGYLCLHEDGFVRLEPDQPFSDELAGDERRAIGKSSRWTGRLAIIFLFLAGGLAILFLILAGLSALAGWIMGRTGGASRISLKEPRSLDETDLNMSDDGVFHAKFFGFHPKPFEFSWRPGEIDRDEASRFLQLCERFRAARLRR